MNPLEMSGVEWANNANNYPAEKLLPLTGQFIAWSLDGKEILTHAWTLEEVFDEMERRGRRDFIYDYLPAEWDMTGRPIPVRPEDRDALTTRLKDMAAARPAGAKVES